VLVAVETDGTRYAAMGSTRERDRLQAERLRRLGWEYVRIWSTDLFRDPARDVARISAMVRQASAARPAATRPAQSTPAGTGPSDSTQAEGTPAAITPVATGPSFAATRSAPEQTRDDTDAGWGERPDQDAQDDWLREQRPPHWG
jgi:hypothetical protein